MAIGALKEWSRHWSLVAAAAFGCSTSGLSLYSASPFMDPITQHFGWSRATFSLGITFCNIGAALFAVVAGRMIDRLGPRVTGISGIVCICLAIASLGTSTGSVANWLALWVFIGVGAAWVQPTVWTSAVASRFDASRGLAIAITISGTGIAAAILPLLATWLIDDFGWRRAFFGIGLAWALVVLPVVLLFFRGKYDRTRASREPHIANERPGLTVAQGLRARAFHKLVIAAGLFVFVTIALIIHMVPILEEHGLSRMGAAGIAGSVGLASIAGRFVAGFMLDRWRADRLAMIAFALPAASAALFLLAGQNVVALTIAAGLVGLALGSELDITLYLATRHFGLRSFGSLFSVIFVAFTAGAAAGPPIAGMIVDRYESYDMFLMIACPVVLIASLIVGSLGAYPAYDVAVPSSA